MVEATIDIAAYVEVLSVFKVETNIQVRADKVQIAFRAKYFSMETFWHLI